MKNVLKLLTLVCVATGSLFARTQSPSQPGKNMDGVNGKTKKLPIHHTHAVGCTQGDGSTYP